MRVIPVIDLCQGQVVRGVAGRRAEYRPLVDGLARSAEPQRVAAALVERFGFREGYLADLDAISGAEPAWDVYAQIQRAGLTLWVDAGVRDAAGARRLAEFDGGEPRDAAAVAPLAGIVLGLETVAGSEELAACVSAVGAERAMFSLDLREGVPLASHEAWRGMSARQIAAAAVDAGVRRAIVLDLVRVGVGEGVGTERLLRELVAAHPQVAWWAGGGVRGPEDLRRLADCGAVGVLVASALHDGRLTPADVRSSIY